MKTAWTSVDERLKKQEMLNERMVKEITYKKTRKSLNTLQSLEFIGIPAMLAVIPFLVWGYGKFGGKFVTWDILVIFGLVFLVAYFPIQLYKAYCLTKVDLAGDMKNNLLYINKFSAHVKREKKIMLFFFMPISTIMMFGTLAEQAMFIVEKFGTEKATKVLAPLIVSASCIAIFTVLYCIWSYKKIYDKNIKTVRENLKELEE
jgi:hypothetical protein